MSFSPVPINTTTSTLDPAKHVHYTLGMILGVDDLNQDFAYLTNRIQTSVRDLIGYGTVCGLQVSKDESDVNKGPGISISPGMAVNPRGQFIRVTPAQCAYINAWLNSTKVSPTVAAHLDGGGKTTLYITLCYRDCLTDTVPVPGEPCRTEDSGELLVPSRVQDDFSLDFSFDRVDQAEEDGLRLCVSWLRQVKIDTPASTQAAFLTAFRQAAAQKFANPPAGSLVLDADHISEFLRAAFLVWTTEIRPTLRGKDADCVTPSTQDCVMLAAVKIKVTGSEQTGWAVDGAVIVDETNRPYLLHLRMIQEWLLTALRKPLLPSDTVTNETSYGLTPAAGTSDHYARADHTHGSPPAVVVPTPDDKALKRERTFGLVQNAGKSASFARADHTHGSPPDPIPAHKADPAAHQLSGDVAGPLNTTVINFLQGQPVKAANPVDGNYLKYVQDHWEPAAAPAGTVGSFVLRPSKAGEYAVSAAGLLTVDAQKPFAAIVSAYYGLAVAAFQRSQFGIEILLTFTDFSPKKNYIVKLTPVVDSNNPPFMAWMLRVEDKGIWVGAGGLQNFDFIASGGLMVEISEFR